MSRGAATTERRRATRACDQCRRTKSRCDNPGLSTQPCRNCLSSSTHCTYLQPSHKRGPPKGYLSALEQRLHGAEGLLGIILSSHDSRAMTLVSDLANDPLAKSIIHTVANGNFGPIGRHNVANSESKSNSRRHSSDLHEQSMNEQETTYLDNDGHLVFTTPTNTWQDYVNFRISNDTKARSLSQAPMETLSRAAPMRPPPPFLLSNCSFINHTPAVPAGRLPPADANSALMNVDSYVSPVSPGNTASHRDSYDADQSDLSSPSVQRSRSTPAMDFGSTDGYSGDEYLSLESYPPLAPSLGLGSDSGFPTPSFGTHLIASSPLDASGPQLRENEIAPPSVIAKIEPE